MQNDNKNISAPESHHKSTELQREDAELDHETYRPINFSQVRESDP